MTRELTAALGLIGLGVLGGCTGGGDTMALKTVPTAHLAISPSGARAVAGTPYSFTVTALDSTDAVVPTYVGTVRITTTDPSATLPANATLARGVGTFVVTFNAMGSQIITAGDSAGNAISGTAGISVAPLPGTLAMTAARAEHTATLLADGKVLITGGFDASGAPLNSAELYDPSDRSFTPTGNMNTARAGHTATLLASGKVLIAGGRTTEMTAESPAYTVNAELYDPSTGTFTSTGDMIAPGGNWLRSGVLLPDGRALVAQGGTAELYDPVAGAFLLAAPYSSPSSVQTLGAVLLHGGSVLILACSDKCSAASDSMTVIYDPTSNTFRDAGPLGTALDVPTTTVLMDGTVLIDDGNEFETPDEVYLYSPSSATFTDVGHTVNAHEFSTATRLNDGTVLLAGGQLPGGNGSSSVELYVPGNLGFVAAPSLRVRRHNHTATLLLDGTVLFAGGWSNWPQSTASAEIYQ